MLKTRPIGEYRAMGIYASAKIEDNFRGLQISYNLVDQGLERLSLYCFVEILFGFGMDVCPSNSSLLIYWTR